MQKRSMSALEERIAFLLFFFDSDCSSRAFYGSWTNGERLMTKGIVICHLVIQIQNFKRAPRCVRDWSGILCERSDNGTSKDRAESPTAELEAEAERPK